MINRRSFIKTAAAAAGTVAAHPAIINASPSAATTGFFGVNDFIENNPDAVFIMRTNVDVKTNGAAIKDVAQQFSRSVFVPKESGYPISTLIPIKPNLTSSVSGGYTLEHGMGIVTDPYFVEGVIEGMKELGIAGNQFHLREVNTPDHFGPRGYTDMAARTGADIRDVSAKVNYLSAESVVWVDAPEGVWYRRIPYMWPINAPNTFMLNIAKFKTHGMGVTLCCKNLQGSICHNYQAHCSYWNMDMNSSDRNPTYKEDITANHARHRDAGVPRWDRPGSDWNSGLGMEIWAARCLDNNQYTPCGLHIIEGVYGRDGNFQVGPWSTSNVADLTNKNGLARDYMSNIIIFGKNQYNNDIIGHYLAGHEPGNFGLFHIAIDRGLNTYLNPFTIPVYEWKDGQAILTPLSEFTRTPLLTYYLQKNYSGQTETYWHMVDEAYDYGPVEVDKSYNGKPEAFVLHQNSPNPFNPTTAIQYDIPSNGNVRLEVYNANGQLVDVLADGYRNQGSHMAVWRSDNHSSGVYFYRLRFKGFSETKKMTLVK